MRSEKYFSGSKPDLIQLFVLLNQQDIRYLVSGSVAAMLYGEPRVTHDIDLVVFLRPADVPKLMHAYPAPDFYLPPENVITAEIAREQRGHFNVIHPSSALKADFYTVGRDELHAWAFRHARQYEFQGTTVRIAPVEYVILRKLEFYREAGSEKHLRDIRAMLAVSGDLMDRSAFAGMDSTPGIGSGVAVGFFLNGKKTLAMVTSCFHTFTGAATGIRDVSPYNSHEDKVRPISISLDISKLMIIMSELHVFYTDTHQPSRESHKVLEIFSHRGLGSPFCRG